MGAHAKLLIMRRVAVLAATGSVVAVVCVLFLVGDDVTRHPDVREEVGEEASEGMALSFRKVLLAEQKTHKLLDSTLHQQKLDRIAHRKQVQKLKAAVKAAQSKARKATQKAAAARKHAAKMERKNKHVQQDLEYNLQSRRITAQIAHRANLAVKVALKQSKDHKSAARKAAVQLKKAQQQALIQAKKMRQQALAQSRASAKAHAAELAKLTKAHAVEMKKLTTAHAVELSALHQKVGLLRKRSRKALRDLEKGSAKALQLVTASAKAEQLRLKTKQTTLNQAFQEEHSQRLRLISKFKKQAAKSARLTQASLIAARSQAVKSTEIKIAGMKRALAEREKKLRAEEKLKLNEAESVERHTEESAAEELLNVKNAARVEQAKLITQYTGVVPTNLGDDAKAAGKAVQKRQKSLLKAMNDPKAMKVKLAYVGCFSDRASDRDVAHLMPVETNVPAKCAAMCRTGHHTWKYAALQNGKQCFCGAKYGRHGKEPEASCFKKCQGGKAACGGVMRNSIYSLPSQ